jgi:glycosyltransferase involved in cell wall biosynthesis
MTMKCLIGNLEPRMSRPLRVMFVITSMPVGGAETLLSSLVRSFNRRRVEPQICCLKEPGPLGEVIKQELPLHSQLIRHKFDIPVIRRLAKLYQRERIDAVVTVGAGDKMFWGRLAARWANVPVILSALHSTGWPDGVGRLNRWLTPLTDGFIGVARTHGEFLVERERFPRDKVFVIRNGIDTQRFQFDLAARELLRKELGIKPHAPVVGIIAALRPEKNHRVFLEAARLTADKISNAQFLIGGDGPERQELSDTAAELGIARQVHFLGNVQDTPGLLSAIDLFALTSDNEASPVSIIEALACQRPVVATRVGSVPDLISEGETGYLVPVQDPQAQAARWVELLSDREQRERFGATGREFTVQHASIEEMVLGYTRLIEKKYAEKSAISPALSIPWPRPRAVSKS